MNRIKNIWLNIITYRTFIKMEFSKKQPFNVSRKLKNLKAGFLSVSSIFYDFPKNDKREYLSDWNRLKRASRINDRKKILIDDKLVFHHQNQGNKYVKPIVGITKKQKLFEKNKNCFIQLRSKNEFEAFVRKFKNGLIIKPYTGGGGARISKVQFIKNQLFFEGACKNYEDFERTVIKNTRAEFLMTEIIKQTGLLAQVYPDTLNTIRILTMYDHKVNKPFVARAVQRVGTSRSEVVDNFTAGGISITIDVESGLLGKGTRYPEGKQLIWYSSHPDTGIHFEGKRIKNWENIKHYILNLSEQYFYIPYIGWDVVPMEDDFIILEANSNSDVNLLQIHGGLLKNEEIKEFYKFHKVIK